MAESSDVDRAANDCAFPRRKKGAYAASSQPKVKRESVERYIDLYERLMSSKGENEDKADSTPNLKIIFEEEPLNTMEQRKTPAQRPRTTQDRFPLIEDGIGDVGHPSAHICRRTTANRNHSKLAARKQESLPSPASKAQSVPHDRVSTPPINHSAHTSPTSSPPSYPPPRLKEHTRATMPPPPPPPHVLENIRKQAQASDLARLRPVVIDANNKLKDSRDVHVDGRVPNTEVENPSTPPVADRKSGTSIHDCHLGGVKQLVQVFQTICASDDSSTKAVDSCAVLDQTEVANGSSESDVLVPVDSPEPKPCFESERALTCSTSQLRVSLAERSAPRMSGDQDTLTPPAQVRTLGTSNDLEESTAEPTHLPNAAEPARSPSGTEAPHMPSGTESPHMPSGTESPHMSSATEAPRMPPSGTEPPHIYSVDLDYAPRVENAFIANEIFTDTSSRVSADQDTLTNFTHSPAFDRKCQIDCPLQENTHTTNVYENDGVNTRNIPHGTEEVETTHTTNAGIRLSGDEAIRGPPVHMQAASRINGQNSHQLQALESSQEEILVQSDRLNPNFERLLRAESDKVAKNTSPMMRMAGDEGTRTPHVQMQASSRNDGQSSHQLQALESSQEEIVAQSGHPNADPQRVLTTESDEVAKSASPTMRVAGDEANVFPFAHDHTTESASPTKTKEATNTNTASVPERDTDKSHSDTDGLARSRDMPQQFERVNDKHRNNSDGLSRSRDVPRQLEDTFLLLDEPDGAQLPMSNTGFSSAPSTSGDEPPSFLTVRNGCDAKTESVRDTKSFTRRTSLESVYSVATQATSSSHRQLRSKDHACSQEIQRAVHTSSRPNRGVRNTRRVQRVARSPEDLARYESLATVSDAEGVAEIVSKLQLDSFFEQPHRVSKKNPPPPRKTKPSNPLRAPPTIVKHGHPSTLRKLSLSAIDISAKPMCRSAPKPTISPVLLSEWNSQSNMFCTSMPILREDSQDNNNFAKSGVKSNSPYHNLTSEATCETRAAVAFRTKEEEMPLRSRTQHPIEGPLPAVGRLAAPPQRSVSGYSVRTFHVVQRVFSARDITVKEKSEKSDENSETTAAKPEAQSKGTLKARRIEVTDHHLRIFPTRGKSKLPHEVIDFDFVSSIRPIVKIKYLKSKKGGKKSPQRSQSDRDALKRKEKIYVGFNISVESSWSSQQEFQFRVPKGNTCKSLVDTLCERIRASHTEAASRGNSGGVLSNRFYTFKGKV